MAIGPGAILFTSNFVSPEAGDGQEESFSFIATEDIAAGEVITFHAPDSSTSVEGTAAFSYTVGPAGLSAFDRVTLAESGNVITIINDPSGGSVDPMFFNLTQDEWSITLSDNIIASSDGEAIAAISNKGDWDQNLNFTFLDRTAIDLAIANDVPSPVIENITTDTTADSNLIFAGTDIADLDNPAFWVGTDTTQDFSSPNIGGTTYATQDANINCFAPGTLIATPDGEVPVETLTTGDLILTDQGRAVKLLWLGHQTRMPSFGMAEPNEPVRISAGALGDNLPHSDLVVTADHGMIIDGFVINASALVNGTTIDFVPDADLPNRITFYHIETEDHDVILANGAPSETFIDYLGRRAFDNYDEYLSLYGAERIIPEMPSPRISAQRMLPDAIRVRLGIDNEMFDLDFDVALCA